MTMIGKMRINRLFPIILIFLVGCEIGGNKTQNSTSPTYITVNNRDYFFNVDTLLKGAHSYIHIVMYEMTNSSDSLSKIELLKRDLINKAQAGVDIKVILEHSGDNYSLNSYNSDAKTYLEGGGVKVVFDSDAITTHSKLIIVDGRVIVIGSTNWSTSAIEYNNETSIMIDDENIASIYENYFENLWLNYGGSSD